VVGEYSFKEEMNQTRESLGSEEMGVVSGGTLCLNNIWRKAFIALR
jgi:hypothetical protein